MALRDADLIDDRLTTTIAYAPGAARSEVLESVLSTWLPTVEDLAAGDGLAPDGPLRINIDHGTGNQNKPSPGLAECLSLGSAMASTPTIKPC